MSFVFVSFEIRLAGSVVLGCSIVDSMVDDVGALHDSPAMRQRPASSSGQGREGLSIFQTHQEWLAETERWSAHGEGRHSSQSGLTQYHKSRGMSMTEFGSPRAYRRGLAANRYLHALSLSPGPGRQTAEVYPGMSTVQDDVPSVSEEGSVAGNASAEVEHDALVYPHSRVCGCLAGVSWCLREVLGTVGEVCGSRL